MAVVTTSKPVNLYQLGQTFAVPPGFRMIENGEDRTIKTGDVDQAALEAAVAAHVADPALIDPASQGARLAAEDQEVKRQAVTNAVASLRQWADDAEATTVTSANAVAVLNTTLDRLAVFFDRFADLIESQQI